MEYKTSVFYAGGGSTYTFPFEYLQKSFVKVRYQNPDGVFQYLEFGKDYTIEENRVNLITLPNNEDKVNIYRSTPTDRMVKYVDASILKAHDMNVNELQTLHIMEEQTDYLTAYALFRGDKANVWEAGNLRIVNLAAPLEPTDAVNKAYVDEYGVTWQQNVAQMKKQLQDQDNNIAAQLDAQNSKVTKQLQDQQTAFNNQLNEQDASFNDRISAHDTELLNKVDKNNQQYKADLQTYNNNLAKQISDDATTKLNQSEKWAQASVSPDNASDTYSPTGKTQSSKSWALYSKERAAAAATSASAAKTSEGNAANSASMATVQANAAKEQATASTNSASASAKSATAAKDSEDKAKTSEVNAKASEVAAAESAKQSAAGQINADWNETNADSMAFIKNKPDVVLKSNLASSVSTSSLTVSGETSVPTANEGNSSNTIASTEFVAKSLAKMVDSAPESLNTLNELAKALGNDPHFATTVLNELGKKMNSVEAESIFFKKTDCPFPVGSVYTTATGDDPNEIWVGTTWVTFAHGRVLMGSGSYVENGITYTYTNGDTGGEVKHTLSLDESPTHNHFGTTESIQIWGRFDAGSELRPDFSNIAEGVFSKEIVSGPHRNTGGGSDYEARITLNSIHQHRFATDSVGEDQPHENRMPFEVVAFWKRIA